MLLAISSMAAEVSSTVLPSVSALAATWRALAPICSMALEVTSTLAASTSALVATCWMLPAMSSIASEVSSATVVWAPAEAESRSALEPIRVTLPSTTPAAPRTP
ncbi:hypothetical protein D3C87_1371130 [compost metagenome]